jgi:hypothetical protein
MTATEISQIFDEEVRDIEQRIKDKVQPDQLTVFYGSSTLRLWDTMQADLAPLHTLNLGFGGSFFQACIHYFEQLFRHVRPTSIVL